MFGEIIKLVVDAPLHGEVGAIAINILANADYICNIRYIQLGYLMEEIVIGPQVFLHRIKMGLEGGGIQAWPRVGKGREDNLRRRVRFPGRTFLFTRQQALEKTDRPGRGRLVKMDLTPNQDLFNFDGSGIEQIAPQLGNAVLLDRAKIFALHQAAGIQLYIATAGYDPDWSPCMLARRPFVGHYIFLNWVRPTHPAQPPHPD